MPNLDRKALRQRTQACTHSEQQNGTKKLWFLTLQTKGDLSGGSQCTAHLRITGLEAWDKNAESVKKWTEPPRN